nr:hypothetical protein [Tanacetum cinerariifolium]
EHDTDFRTPSGAGAPRRQAAQATDPGRRSRVPPPDRRRAEGSRRRTRRPLLLRSGHPGPGGRNGRLCVGFA